MFYYINCCLFISVNTVLSIEKLKRIEIECALCRKMNHNIMSCVARKPVCVVSDQV